MVQGLHSVARRKYYRAEKGQQFWRAQTALGLQPWLKENEQMASGLTNQETITVGNETFPTPLLLANISLLHRILEEVLEDWLRAVEPYQRRVDDADDDSAVVVAGVTGFAELQPLLLKCLFSYAFFFVAAANAYRQLYADLNQANRDSGLHVRHDKEPKDTPFIKKNSLDQKQCHRTLPRKDVKEIVPR